MNIASPALYQRLACEEKMAIGMVAGEASGDMVAAHLLGTLRSHLPTTQLYGIGGAKMKAQGFVSHWPMEKLSINGLEVLKHYRELRRFFATVRDAFLQERPALFIGVDAPEFNLSLETDLYSAGIPTMHIVCPSIWAWRRGRIKHIRRSGAHMLVIFPFEEALLRQANIPVTYIGHPLAQIIPMTPDTLGARKRCGLQENKLVVTLLPGSRLSELRLHTLPFIQTIQQLRMRDPDLQCIVPMVGKTQQHTLAHLIANAGLSDVPLQISCGNAHDAIEAADIVLVASGTASLEVALYKKPMVIAYRMSWATYFVGRMVTYLPWIGLPNILARETLVPEFIQQAMTPQNLADALWRQLHDEPHKDRLRQRFTDMHYSLLRHTGQESAQAVLQVLNK